jgi:hypothetical protein
MQTKQEIIFSGSYHKNFLSNKFSEFQGFIQAFQKWTFINVQNRDSDFQVRVKIRKKYSVQNQDHVTEFLIINIKF